VAYPVPEEFAPLPHLPWDVRPDSVLLDEDESSTALFIAGGDIGKAADLLKVSVKRLKKAIRRSGKLPVLLSRLSLPPPAPVR
jgi:hypothetical protein